jgi:hypothetical protein
MSIFKSIEALEETIQFVDSLPQEVANYTVVSSGHPQRRNARAPGALRNR